MVDGEKPEVDSRDEGAYFDFLTDNDDDDDDSRGLMINQSIIKKETKRTIGPIHSCGVIIYNLQH